MEGHQLERQNLSQFVDVETSLPIDHRRTTCCTAENYLTTFFGP